MSVQASVTVTCGSFTLDATVEVDDGSVLALVGPNGSGKTTLLNVVAGLQPLDRGTVRIGATAVDDPAAGRFVPPESRAVGVVFQEYVLFPHLDARDNVAFGLRARGWRRGPARQLAEQWLDRLGVAHVARSRPSDLSGGQAQRVALARALALEPDVLLLDEPLSALDARTRDEIRRDLRAHLEAFPGAAIVVTHDALDAAALADRVAILDGGRLLQVGEADEVLAHPRSPYVADLVGVNLLEGYGRGGEVELASGGRVVVAEPVHGPVFVAIDPRAVVLSAERPSGSARNVWHLRIAGVESVGERARVRLEGTVSLVGEVTTASVAALGLAEGRGTWCSVKATEVRVSPR